MSLQAGSGPEGSRKLRFPDFMTTARDCGKVVSLTHRPPLPQEIHLVLITDITHYTRKFNKHDGSVPKQTVRGIET